MTVRPMPEREYPGREPEPDPVYAFLGRVFAYVAIFLAGSIAVLAAAVVIGLAIRIVLIVSGVAS